MLLCPISLDENKFVSKSHYKELLSDSISITNNLGYDIEIRDEKRMIHFSKIGIEDAIKIYMRIGKSEPQNYHMLNAFIETLHNFELENK